MARIKALCLAGVAGFALTASAFAADLPLPAPPVFEPPPAPIAAGGWYLRGDAGVGISDLRTRSSEFSAENIPPDARFDSHSLDDAALIDVGVGYRFNDYFRADVTGTYHGAAHFGAIESYQGAEYAYDGTRSSDSYSASIRTITGLVNGYVDLGCWYGLTPFVGAGVGVANVRVAGLIDQNGGGYAADHSQTNFAFALMAGLDFAVTRNLTMELGYRYLDAGSARSGAIQCYYTGAPCPQEQQRYKLAYNDIRLGFRYMFNDIVPQRGPIIARSRNNRTKRGY